MRRSRDDPQDLQLHDKLTVESLLALDAGVDDKLHPTLHLTVNTHGEVGLDLEYHPDSWAEVTRPRSDEPWDRVRWEIARGPCIVDLERLRTDVRREPTALLLLGVARGIMHRRDHRDIDFITLTARARWAQRLLQTQYERTNYRRQVSGSDECAAGLVAAGSLRDENGA